MSTTSIDWPRASALGLALLLLPLAAGAGPTGLSTNQARTAAPVAQDPSRTTNVEGTSAAFARADHQHAFSEYRTVLIPGSVCDGTQNARTVIQAALDSGAGQPVRVKLPPATCKVWPAAASDTYPGHDCLSINYSNVVLEGAGRTATTISCVVAGGLDPNTNWEIVHITGTPYVWRGNGIVLAGSTIANVTIRQLRLTGNSPRNLTTYPVWAVGPGQSFPANVSTGEGWDITNKAIVVGNGTTRTNVVMEDLELDSFRGEIIYYGGSSGNQGMVVRRSILHDSIGSMLSASGSMTVTDNEMYLGENAIENTPLADEQLFERNFIHDNKVGVTITSNAAAPTGGVGRTRVLNNRIKKNYLGGLWVLGAIRGYLAKGNEVADSPQNGHVLLGGCGGGSGPQDATFEGNVFRNETQFTGVAFRIASDAGCPIKNIRIIRNRTELSQYVKDNSGSISGLSYDLADAASTVYVERNDFSAGTSISPGSATESAVPYWGGANGRNILNAEDYQGSLDFAYGGTASLSGVRPITPSYQLQPAAGRTTLASMSGTGIILGQIATLWVNGVNGSSVVYVPATGTGWFFHRPYWLKSVQSPYRSAMLLWVRWDGNRWVEQAPLDGHNHRDSTSIVWDIDAVPYPTTANYWWLSTEDADTLAPTIPLYYEPSVTLAPASARTYTTFTDARPDVPVVVNVNANVTISNSATLKLTGGTSFAPGGTGGVITFVRPAGKSALYEVSRMAY